MIGVDVSPPACPEKEPDVGAIPDFRKRLRLGLVSKVEPQSWSLASPQPPEGCGGGP